MTKLSAISVLLMLYYSGLAQEYTLFTTETPGTYSSDNSYELGTEFRALVKGSVTRVRLYTGLNEGGDHAVRLWRRNGSNYTLVSGPFTWNLASGTQGWREYSLPSPIPLDSGLVYVVAVSNSTDFIYANTVSFTPAATSNAVAYISGVYTRTAGRAPNKVSSGRAYFRDIVFVPAAAPGNAPPAISLPASAQSIPANTNLVFSTSNGNAITVNDPDNGAVSVSISVTNGTFSLQGTGGLAFTAGDGTADAIMTFSGTLSDINTAFNTSTFSPVPDYTGTASVLFSVNDGEGGTASGTFPIQVYGVNNPPVISAPSAVQNVNEDAVLTFSGTNGNPVIISDPDNTAINVNLTVANGAFTLSGTSGLSFTTGDGTNDASMTFSGLPASLNTALNGASFLAAQNYSGPASVSFSLNDGAGGTTSASISVSVLAVNDPPAVALPSVLQHVNENSNLVFNPTNGNPVSVSDQDNPSGTITITATQGTFSLSGTSGLTFSTGDGVSDALMTFSGQLTAVNLALNGSSYAPATDYSGPASVNVSIDDGSGGQASGSISIQVDSIAGPPPGNAEYTLFTTEVPASFSSDNLYELGTEFRALVRGSVTKVRLFTSQVEGGSHTIRIWLRNGTTYSLVSGPHTWDIPTGVQGWREFDLPVPLTLEAGTVYVVAISNSTDRQYARTLNFVPAQANDKISYIGGVYTRTIGSAPNQTYSGSSYFRDLVFVPEGTTNNAPPVIMAPATSQSGTEDVSLYFGPSTGNAISVSDPDNTSATLSITVTGGRFTLSGTSGLSFTTGDGVSDVSMTFSGPISQINTVLSNAYYTPSPDHNGTASLTLTASDGLGGTGTATISINLAPVNDAPSVNIPAAIQTVVRNTDLVFSTSGNNPVSAGDIDNAAITLSIASVNGAFSLSGVSGLIFTAGDGDHDESMSFSGLLTDISNALSAPVFTPHLDYTGDASVLITADDNSGGIQSGTIAITVIDSLPQETSKSNRALVLVNSGSGYYSQFLDYIKPYLDHFGISYQLMDVNSGNLPAFTGYALVIFGHNRVFESGYPVSSLEQAVFSGTGLYSFDPHLFDYSSAFNTAGTVVSAGCGQINVLVTTPQHYITEKHTGSQYDRNIYLSLFSNITLSRNGSLVNGTVLAEGQSGSGNIPLLEVTGYGSGRVVRWNSCDWMLEQYFGPMRELDDLIWRGMVWAARKPFVMMGMPPFVTMRVDDVDGTGGNTSNFSWVSVSTNYGFRPWLGLFINAIPAGNIPTLKTYIDNSLVTASPHSFTNDDFLYFNHNGVNNFDPVANCIAARNFFTQNQLTMSKFIIPHVYEMSPLCGPSIAAMGAEFIGVTVPPGNDYETSPWLNRGPFRINRYGMAGDRQPVYYADTLTIGGSTFFNSLTEIRDDGGYEWYPRNDQVGSTVARGVRHLKRSLNNMALASLFTHENYIDNITATNWNSIMQQVTTRIASYNPIYTTLDYALKYVRAKKSVTLLDVTDYADRTEISYSAANDMNTQCYYYTESGGVITFRSITIPQFNGTNSISVTH